MSAGNPLWKAVRPMVLALLFCGAPAAAADLRAYTEQFPPFNYQQDGQPQGLAVELLQLIARRAGLSLQLEFRPWQRAVNENADDANSLLFTTVRTPQRESLYRWLGPIDPCDIVLIKLASRQDIQIHMLSDAFRYQIGVPTVGANRELLGRLGFPPANLQLVPPSGSVVRMLHAGRFDLTSGVLLSYAYQSRLAGLPAGELRVAYTLQKGLGCYYAFNPAVDPQLFQRFQRAFQEIERDGSLRQLRNKYR